MHSLDLSLKLSFALAGLGWDMGKILIIGAVALTLVGCATKYQEMGLTGGVAAEQMTADTWRIKARGNGYTDKTTVQDYVMLKAAETTQAAGGTHFLIISAADASRKESVVSGGSASTTVIGNQRLRLIRHQL